MRKISVSNTLGDTPFRTNTGKGARNCTASKDITSQQYSDNASLPLMLHAAELADSCHVLCRVAGDEMSPFLLVDRSDHSAIELFKSAMGHHTNAMFQITHRHFRELS